jgi:hypothetical protein
LKKVFILLLAISLVRTGRAAGPVRSDSSVRKNSVAYYFSFGMGAMIGCEQCRATGKTASFTTSLVQGVRLGKKGSMGAGIGFDAYENWKTMPLFGSASWDLFGKRNKVFVQLDYGYAGAWINKDVQGYGYKKSEGGKMVNPLLGYRIRSGNVRFLFSLGYKFQRVFSFYNNPTVDIFPEFYAYPNLAPSTREIRTDMNRFVVGMAIGWK